VGGYIKGAGGVGVEGVVLGGVEMGEVGGKWWKCRGKMEDGSGGAVTEAALATTFVCPCARMLADRAF